MNAFRITRRDDGVAIITLDCPDEPVNTLSPSLLAEFEEKISPLLDEPGVRALVLASGKKDTFIAGADLHLLDEMGAAEAEALSRSGNALLSRIAASKKPVVAAIHGAALGGGLEVALACHYLLASDDPATVLGLPEVMLGVLPAGGGTQRLPRRLGLSAALSLLLTGQRLRARKAFRLGLVDGLTTAGGIAETAARAALLLAEHKLKRRRLPLATRLMALPPMRGFILRAARKQVMHRTQGLYPAPLAVLECVTAGLSKGVRRGLDCESHHFGELVASRQGKLLIGLYHAMNEAKKDTGEAPARPVRRLGILGAGFMGSGIASVSLSLGPVVVRDVADETLTGAARSIREGLEKQLASGAITRTERDRRHSRLLLTREVGELGGADLVIEAVFEELELKRRVLAEIEEVVSAEAVLASNTSALPIAAIAEHARHPERVLGMHYFSPVPKMPLLELVVSEQTAPWAVATARAFATAQGKTVIAVKDSPGFYTTRILACYLNEAMLLLEEGARVEEVDGALVGWGFPVGPLALLDEVGIDVGAHVAHDLSQAFAARGLASSSALPRLAEAGLLGRKSRKGFYVYPAPGGKGHKRPNKQVYAFFGGSTRLAMPAEEIADRMAFVMINEAITCFDEGVIATPRDGDLGAILGLGFPPFTGGPFHHVDTVGAASLARRLEEQQRRLGPRFKPAAMLLEIASKGGRFYER